MKKLLSLTLTAALLLTLVACGAQPAAISNPPLILGEKYLTDLDYEQALLQFDQAIEIEPKNPRGYLGKADALLHLNRQPDAVQALSTGAKATKGDIRNALTAAQAEVAKSIVEGYIGLSAAYEKLGWKEIAIALLNRVCEELPEDSMLREALERLEEVLERLAEEELSQKKEEIENLETAKITEAEYAEVKAYIAKTYNTLSDIYIRNGLDADKIFRGYYARDIAQSGDSAFYTYEQYLNEVWNNHQLLVATNYSYDFHSIQKISSKGLERFLAIYNGQSYADFLADFRQAYMKANAPWSSELELVIKLFYESRLPLGNVTALYKANVTVHYSNTDGTSSSTTGDRYIVKMNGNLQGVMIWYNSEAGSIA